MRIAYFIVGAATFDSTHPIRRGLVMLASTQLSLGCEVTIYCFSKYPPTQTLHVRVRTFAPPPLPFWLPATMLREIEEWAPDILSLHQPYQPANATLAAWARRAGIPYCATPHGALSPGELRERWLLKLPYKYLFERRILNNARFVRAVGDREYLEDYGVTAPVLTIPNGFDFSTVPDRLDTDLLTRRIPEIAGRRVFVYLGRLDAVQKGLDLLLHAIATLQNDNAAFVLCGPDWRGGRHRLRKQIAALQLNDRVFMIDAIYGDDKWNVLAGADCFVHPSRWEGLPNAVLEAAALGLPTLLTRPADPLGRLAATESAFRVSADVESIADGLRNAANVSRDTLSVMGIRARKVVETEFSWTRTAHNLMEAYRTYALGDPSPDNDNRTECRKYASRRSQ